MSLTIAAQLGQIPAHHLNIMGYVDESAVNGPGCRSVVWVQGCSRECRGCFNQASWSFEINQLITVESLAAKILANPRNSGLTFSGGEPFWQAKALTELAKYVKEKGLNVMSFTGFTIEQLRSTEAPPHSQELLAQLDILVDGAYVESLAIHSPDSPVLLAINGFTSSIPLWKIRLIGHRIKWKFIFSKTEPEFLRDFGDRLFLDWAQNQ